MKNIIFLIGICFMFSCSQVKPNSESQSEATAKDDATDQEKVADTLSIKNAESNLNASSSNLSASENDIVIQINLSADVLFDFDKAVLEATANPELQKVKEVIEQKGKGTVIITGYTDAKGSAVYNKNLSLQRAEAVKNWMLAQGLKNNFQISGKGAEDPVATNENADGSDNPEGRSKNRRVEIIVNRTKTLGK